MTEKSKKSKMHSPSLNGVSITRIFEDIIEELQQNKGRFNPKEMLSYVDEDNLCDDGVTQEFRKDGGPEEVIHIISLPGNMAFPTLASRLRKYKTILASDLRNNYRFSYMALQNFLDKNNDAAKLERVASKNDDKSAGYWQIKSLESLDKLSSLVDNIERITIANLRSNILSGDRKELLYAKDYVKACYEALTPKETRRLAYTSLSTQDNEPYLMCPKGKYVFGKPVAMEVSKCRFNCIDSRVAEDGSVTCAYQDWLKVAFISHDETFARLDVHRSSDNDTNINLSEGQRSKDVTDADNTYEMMFDKSTQGANSMRDKSNYDDSIQSQLSSMKPSQYGHTEEKKSRNTKTSQTDHNKVIDQQLPRTNSTSVLTLEELLRNINNTESDTDTVTEELLQNADMMGHRGEMEVSYAHQLADNDSDYKHISSEINDKAEDGDDMTVSQHLNKTAKKVEKDLSFDSHLEDSRTNSESDLDKTIEQLLSDTDEDSWGHQFSEEDLKHFASELGLDSLLEESRE